MSSLRIVLTLILALFLALVVACDGGSDGPEPPTGDVRGPTSVTVAPEPVSTPTPLEPLLTQDIPPCTPAEGTSVGPCEPGTGLVHLAFASERIDDEPFSIRWYLGSEGSGSGLHASHLVVRGTHLPETVRCVPEFLFQAGGEGTPELLDSIKCYTDIRVNEYLLGSGPSTLTVLVHHGKYREAMDQEEIDRSTSRLERALIEGGRWDQLSTGGIIGREAVLFLGPEDNREVEVWEIFTGWTLVERQNEDDTTTVLAIHPHSGYWAREDAAEWEQQRSTLFEVPLPTFRQAITAAHSGRVADFGGRTSRKPDAPMLVSAASELRQFLTSVGAYSDPNDVPKKPGEPCGKVVANQVDNPGLMVDCLELLALKDALRGTGTLNWGTDTAMSSWAGVTTAGTPSRITKVEVADESLSGTIPGSLGGLAKLTHLDLSNNSLTGQIPEELDQLSNLTNLKLSGNAGLTGCIPKALRSVSTNDLSSLSISYCPSEPQSLTVGTPGENSIPLSWDAVANATRYRVEELRGRKWVVVDDTITATSYAVEDLYCSQQYRFQVRAYVTDWSGPSSVIETHAGACVPPTIGSSTYSFTARSDEGTVVGSISATGSLGADDQVAYVIHPDDLADGKFAMNVDTGEITFAKDLAAEVGKTVEITVFIFDKSGGYAEIPANITVTASCSSGTAVPSPTANTGLVEDCKTLLDLKSELAGTGTLNWSGDLAMSDWSGISTGGTPKRVIGVKLKNSGLGGVIPAALGDLAQLQDLWLGGNQLTGEIPPELGNLTSLYSLYLDQNRLTGEIPAELGNMSALEDLYLYNNQLTGSIPPEVSGLEELRQLWITNNQLTGVLPGELAGLEELYNLRLSGNSFEGCVPAGLRDVATNDVSSLGLEDCPAGVVPAPTGLSASLAEGIFTLTWDAVTGAGLYEVQHTTDAADAASVTWTALEAVTGATQTFTPEDPSPCSVAYRFRVRARGDGMTLVASWGAQSAAHAPTPNCLPAFTGAPYAFEVAEDAAEDDEVGTVSAADPDADDTVAYSITAGNTGDVFAIDGNTGAITVTAALDYETTAEYTLTVEASDGRGGAVTSTATVTVTDVAEDPPPAPEQVSVSLEAGVFSLSWDEVEGAAQYEAQHTTDAADAETVTWTALDAVTSVAQTYTPEEAPTCGDTYRFRVRALGDGETYAEVWGDESAISSLAPNCPPEFTGAPYAFEVAEDAAEDDAVGTVSTTDPEGDAVTYAITGGNDDGHFAIDGSTGAITVAAELDYETTEEYTLTVEASDSRGGAAESTATITVTDVAEDLPPAPEGLEGTLADGTFTLTWTAVDGAFSYEVQVTTDGADAETVTWTALDAVTSVAQTYTPEEAPACGDTYRFRVRAFGDGETYAEVWGAESAASSLAPNCPPAFTNTPYAFAVSEDAAGDDAVGTVSATDPEGDAVTYAITGGNDDGHFAIDGSTGAITVAAELDYETTEEYTLTVEASDSRGGAAESTATITVTDVAEDLPPAPEGLEGTLADGTFTLTWTAVDGAFSYEVQVTTDGADAETVTWTALDAVTSVAQTYTPEEAPACGDTYRFRVRAFGDGETYAEVWGAESAASSLAPNCPPAFTNTPYAFAVSEDAAGDDAVGTVSATDPDGDTVTYSITDGNGDSHFTLDGSAGAITVAAELDYETTASYTLTVTADDLKGGTATATVTITVTDVIGEGEPELLGGMVTAGSFNMAHADAFGYTSGLTWSDIASEGTLGTLDDTSFEYGGQTYTVQLAAYFEAVGTRDPYFFIGLKERLLPTDMELVAYVGGNRLAGWQTTGLGELMTHYYYVADPGFTLESGQVVALSLRKANPSSDTGLDSLSLGAVALSPGFEAGTTSYTATVANDVAEVTVTAEAASDYATAAVTPAEGDDPDTDGVEVALVEGQNIVTVTVTAEDGTTATYTVTVTRQGS